MINIYTDGSSRGNPGPGGYGIIWHKDPYYKEGSQGYRKTTNNRMELLAVIVALETLKRPGSDVTVYSDSKYVIDAITKGWVFNWAKKGFSGKKNPDLWRRYLKIHPTHNIRYVWVKGHNNHPQNERCDTLAVNAALSSDLLIDQGYEDSEGR